MTLFFREMGKGKIFERSVSSFWGKIEPVFILTQKVAETALPAE